MSNTICQDVPLDFVSLCSKKLAYVSAFSATILGNNFLKKYFHSFGIYSKKDFAVLVSQTLPSSQVTDSSVWLLSSSFDQGYILSQGPAFLTSL